jgi:hypothetical protein
MQTQGNAEINYNKCFLPPTVSLPATPVPAGSWLAVKEMHFNTKSLNSNKKYYITSIVSRPNQYL